MDCVRAAIRYGARETVCAYRREESEMRCGHQEFQSALEEGAQFLFRVAPVAILGDGSSQVTGVRLTRTEPGPLEAPGKQSLRFRPGSEFVVETDWVIAALGFESRALPPGNDLTRLARNDWGGVMVDGNQMTSLPGVFAGGDLVHGPCSLLHAVRDARRAADQIHTYLSAERGVH